MRYLLNLTKYLYYQKMINYRLIAEQHKIDTINKFRFNKVFYLAKTLL